jgi:hypothetical protein
MAARLCGAGLRNWCNNPAVHLRREASARGRRIADSNIEPSSLEVASFPLNALSSAALSYRTALKKNQRSRKTWADCAPITLVCQE